MNPIDKKNYTIPSGTECIVNEKEYITKEDLNLSGKLHCLGKNNAGQLAFRFTKQGKQYIVFVAADKVIERK